MSKYILTNRESFLNTLNKSPLNEGAFGDLLSDFFDDVASGKYAKSKDVDNFRTILKETMKKIRSAFGIEESDPKKMKPITMSHNGKELPLMGVKLSKVTEEIYNLTKQFYIARDIGDIKDYLFLFSKKLKEIKVYTNVVADTPSFDELAFESGYSDVKGPEMDKLERSYKFQIDKYKNAFKTYFEDYFLNYYEELLDSEPDIIKPEISIDFVAPNKISLANIYEKGIKSGFNYKAMFKAEVDISTLVQRNFLLDYTPYPQIARIDKVATDFLSTLIIYKADLEGVSSTSADYTYELYEELINQMLEGLLNIVSPVLKFKTKNPKNLTVDLKRLLVMNAMVLLSTNYWHGFLRNKVGYYVMKKWDKKNLTDFFNFILVNKEQTFNDFFRKALLLEVRHLNTIDFYVKAKGKSSVFDKFYKALIESTNEEDLETGRLNVDPSSKKDNVKTTSTAKDSSKENTRIDQYNIDDYSNPNKAHKSEEWHFMDETTALTGNQNNPYVSVIQELAEVMNISKGSHTDFLALLKIRDYYIKDIEPSFLDAKNQIPMVDRSNKLATSVMMNILGILFFANEKLEKDISTHNLALEAIDYFKTIVSPGFAIDSATTHDIIENKYGNAVSKMNSTLIDFVSKEYFKNEPKRKELVNIFIQKSYGLQTKESIVDFFKTKRYEIIEDILSYAEFKAMVKNEKDYHRHLVIYKNNILKGHWEIGRAHV